MSLRTWASCLWNQETHQPRHGEAQGDKWMLKQSLCPWYTFWAQGPWAAGSRGTPVRGPSYRPHPLHVPSTTANATVTNGKKSEEASPDMGSGIWKGQLRKEGTPWKAQVLGHRGGVLAG